MSHFPDLDEIEDITTTTTTITTATGGNDLLGDTTMDFLTREQEALGSDLQFVTGDDFGDFNKMPIESHRSDPGILASELTSIVPASSHVAKFNAEFPPVDAVSPVFCIL